MLKFERFFKRAGIRTVGNLTSPRINKLEEFILPIESVYHFIPSDNSGLGISTDHWAVKHTDKRLMIDHVTELKGEMILGTPKKTSVNSDTLVRDYHRRYRKARPIRDILKASRDDKTHIVSNYSLLPQLLRYTKSMYSSYYKRFNIVATMWDNLSEIGKETNRYQYLTVELPDVLPSLSMLKKHESEVTNDGLDYYDDVDKILILDIWRWLGDEREKSLISKVDKEVMRKTNIIFKRLNRWFVINLGIIDDWLDVANGGGIDSSAMQKRFLKMLVTLFEATTTSTEADPVVNEIDLNEEDSAKELMEEVAEPIDTRSVRNVLKKTVADNELEEELDSLQLRINEEKLVSERDVFEEEVLTPEQALISKLDEKLQSGEISPNEHKKLVDNSKSHELIKNPYTGKGSMVDAAKVKQEDLVLDQGDTYKDRPTILDKSMLGSTTGKFDRAYIKNVLNKDIIGSVLAITNAGIPITDYEVSEIESVVGAYELHTVRVSPIGGRKSTLSFKIPKIKEDGTYVSNGISYRIRKQRGDMPIRKTNVSTVALTSYYGKLFVRRSPKVVYNYPKWLIRNLKRINVDKNDNSVTELVNNGSFDNSIKVPKIYSTIGNDVLSFKSNGIEFYFGYADRAEHFKVDKLKSVEKSNTVLVGKKASKFITVDDNGTFYELVENKLVELGAIEDIVGIDKTKMPKEVAEIKIMGSNIPLGFVLAYYVGIERLMKSLKLTYRIVPTGSRPTLTEDEYSIVFDDETVILSRSESLGTLIMGSFDNYKKAIAKLSYHDFNKKDVYFNVLSEYGMGIRILKELDLLKDMFIDPITLGILESLEQPTTWIGVLKYAADLLLTDQSLKETDLREMRIKGYERVAGSVYKELVNSIRAYNSNNGSSRAAVDLNPFAVWKAITTDPATTITETANPVKNVNEQEAVTYMGVGGRSRDSLVARTRVFDKSDLGVISESTVDSGDVAVNTFMSANPNLNSLRGTTDRFNEKEDGPSNLMSTAALLSPASDNDDGKRVNFVTIQHAQTISARGYKPLPLRTGYEQVIGERTSDLFNANASQKGKVTALNKKAITVEYSDGSTVSVQLGKRFGNAAGSTYPHVIVTDLSKGDVVDKGDVIAYNENYFAPDPFNPKQSLWKGGALAKTALLEGTDTYEDSSAVSVRFAKELMTDTTKVRTLFVSFEDSVKNLVSMGDKLDPESILCTIEDTVTSDNSLFNDDNLETLKLLSGNSPKAKYGGVVDKVEVIYYGDKEDMSLHLREIVDVSDKQLAQEKRALGEKIVSGQVHDTLRVDNRTLEMDTAVINIYITGEDAFKPGDKLVFGNQMKSIVGRGMEGVNETESGEPIDAFFGYNSIVNRVVLSPEMIGSTNTLLKVVGKKAAEIYFDG